MRLTGLLQRRRTGHTGGFSPDVVSSIPIKSEVELSEHTIGISMSVASVALGAVAIEKHFAHNRADGGVDSIFSIGTGLLFLRAMGERERIVSLNGDSRGKVTSSQQVC